MSKRWKIWSAFLIGKQDNPMLKRLRIIQTPLFGIYVHFIYREDMDRDPHDHPWKFWRMVLKGSYSEVYYKESKDLFPVTRRHKPFRPGYFPQTAAHRITKVNPGTVTIVLVGKKNRTWGFWRSASTFSTWGRYFIPWHEYVTNPVWSQEEAPK